MKYILYGAGHDGLIAMKYLGKDNIRCFCDSQKHGGEIEGIPIVNIEEIGVIDNNTKLLITVSKPEFILDISKKLTLLGYEFEYWENAAKKIIQQETSIYSRLNRRCSFEYNEENKFVVVRDRYDNAGTISSYFWQDLWAAQKICIEKPKMHFDIGSRVDGFISHLLSFKQSVTQIDIRPLNVAVDNYYFIQGDATNLNGIPDNSIDSISALCSLEHFGLGRYGDDIDPDACFKCFQAITSKVRHGGKLYLSVPIGKEHIEFNAHRVFYARTIVNEFSEFNLVEFSSCYKQSFEENIDLNKYDDWLVHGGDRFGLFLFKRK